MRSKKFNLFIIMTATLIFTFGCTKKRPVDTVLPEVHRLDKSFFTSGDFYYNVTVVGSSPDAPISFVGDSNFGASLARFKFTEGNLTAYFPEPRYKENTSLDEPIIVFPIDEHVDIQREKNPDGELTHKEEENKEDRPWNERTYAKIKFGEAKLIPSDMLHISVFFAKKCIEEVGSDLIDLQQDSQSLNITLNKTYRVMHESCSLSDEWAADTFTQKIKISFLKKEENPNFKKVELTDRLEQHVGAYYTTVKEHDKYNQRRETKYAIHRDPTKKIVYYLSPGFPDEYKHIAQRAVDNWNEALKETNVLGKPLLELRDNAGQELGDLRYNFIVWINDLVEEAPGGYGPMHFDPFTGEIISANAFIYAGAYRAALKRILDDKEIVAEAALRGVEVKDDIKMDFKNDLSDMPYSIKTHFKNSKNKESLTGALQDFKHNNGRCYYPLPGSESDLPWYAEKKSEEEIFQQMIADVLIHEMGHNLGLLHNFMGSVDKKHYISEKHRTSSVMDYLASEDSEGGVPGPYDKAALAFGFTSEWDFQKKFMYCTNGDDLIDPFCNMFDRGSSAAEIAQYLSKRYVDTYKYRNLRGKRLHFKQNVHSYMNRLLEYYFLPMREFFDYFVYTLKTNSTYKGEPLNDTEGVVLRTDLAQAANIGYTFFKSVILDKERAYKSSRHPYLGDDEMMAIGTIYDKLLAAEMLSARDFGISLWDSMDANYFDMSALSLRGIDPEVAVEVPNYQIDMLKFYSTLLTDPEVPQLISMLSVLYMINYVPSATDDGLDELPWLRYPSEKIIDNFKITKTPLTSENIQRLNLDALNHKLTKGQFMADYLKLAEQLKLALADSFKVISKGSINWTALSRMAGKTVATLNSLANESVDIPKLDDEIENESMEYVFAEDEGYIYSARKKPVQFFEDNSPAASLLRAYKELKRKFNSNDSTSDTQKIIAEAFAFEQAILQLNEMIPTLDKFLTDDPSNLDHPIIQQFLSEMLGKKLTATLKTKQMILNALKSKLTEIEGKNNKLIPSLGDVHHKVKQLAVAVLKHQEIVTIHNLFMNIAPEDISALPEDQKKLLIDFLGQEVVSGLKTKKELLAAFKTMADNKMTEIVTIQNSIGGQKTLEPKELFRVEKQMRILKNKIDLLYDIVHNRRIDIGD